MANEITYSGTLTYRKGTSSFTMTGSGRADAGTHFLQNIATIGIAEETVPKGDVGTIGHVLFKNLDPLNFIEIGPSPGVYSLRLGPEEATGSMQWGSASIYTKADTAPVRLEYLVVEAAS